MQVMEAREINLEVDHPGTLTAISNLMSTDCNQGWW